MKLILAYFCTDRFKAVPLLHLFYICASMVSYEAFSFSLFVLYLYFIKLFRIVVLRTCAFV